MHIKLKCSTDTESNTDCVAVPYLDSKFKNGDLNNRLYVHYAIGDLNSDTSCPLFQWWSE